MQWEAQSLLNISKNGKYGDTKRFLVPQDWCFTDLFVLPIRTLPYFQTLTAGRCCRLGALPVTDEQKYITLQFTVRKDEGIAQRLRT